MRTQGFLRSLFSGALFLTITLPTFVAGQTAPAAERQKIESLIKQVGELKDAKFIRNGATHDVSTAVRFLRGKWEANDADVKTARDFIDKVASASGTSGKPYLIRFKGGRQTKSRDFLLAELRKLES
jgi:cation diffusion facilitator CzcD-associated flavoprotein CzcO